MCAFQRSMYMILDELESPCTTEPDGRARRNMKLIRFPILAFYCINLSKKNDVTGARHGIYFRRHCVPVFKNFVYIKQRNRMQTRSTNITCQVAAIREDFSSLFDDFGINIGIEKRRTTLKAGKEALKVSLLQWVFSWRAYSLFRRMHELARRVYFDLRCFKISSKYFNAF